MKRLLFDLETDGFLDVVSVIHCGVVLDIDSGEMTEYGPGQQDALIAHLETADVLAGQNICGFDMIVLEKLHAYDVLRHKYLDTLAMSHTLYPGGGPKNMLLIPDRGLVARGVLPSELAGHHSLEAWSHRLKLGSEGKMKYDGGWEKWSPEMQAYCAGDVRATGRLLTHFLKKPHPHEVWHLESMMLYYVEKQRQFGVGFDKNAAVALLVDLAEKRSVLEDRLREVFPPITVKDGLPVTPKRNMVCRKCKEGEEGWFPPRVKSVPYQKYKIEEFNPRSGPQIARRLIAMYGWQPNEFTPGGLPVTSDEVLRDLPWPEAQLCADYKTIEKTAGYLSEGKQAWLSLEVDGRIHGTIYPLGARTHRAAHAKPNLANVPSAAKSVYGKACRALFVAGGGNVPSNYALVGADASALQLAIYAHYVARFDGGLLAKLVGDPDGDAHEYMRKASGLFTRERQKTLTYATWLGAGKYKQGLITLQDWREAFNGGLTDKPVPPLTKAASLGARVMKRMRENMQGFQDMQQALATAAKRGYVVCLDGRRIVIESQHLALGTLLQGNEAIIMKRAYDQAWRESAVLIEIGSAFPVLWVHDEFQWACHPALAEMVGKTLTKAIADAGESLGMRLPLRGNYKVGTTWAETH